MHIALEPDYQRQLLYALKGQRTWRRLAEELGITYGVLMHCRAEDCGIPEKAYRRISSQETDAHVVLEYRPNRSPNKPNGQKPRIVIRKPEKDAELAEIVGIMLGDGCNYYNAYYHQYEVRIAANYANEQEYLRKIVIPLFERLFGLQGKIKTQANIGTIYACFASRELCQFLSGIGIPTGRAKSKAGIPSWIKSKEQFLAACLRGLIDTDGSIFRLSRRDYRLLRISFKNNNRKLLEDARQGFVSLGFHPSKIIINQFFLTRKADITDYVAKIGFNNPKNAQRLTQFSPMV